MNLKITGEDFIKMVKNYYINEYGYNVEVNAYSYQDDRFGYNNILIKIKYNNSVNNFNVEFEDYLKDEDIKKIVQYFFNNEYDIKKAYLDTSRELSGYGYSEHYETVFKGVSIEAEKAKQKVKKL